MINRHRFFAGLFLSMYSVVLDIFRDHCVEAHRGAKRIRETTSNRKILLCISYSESLSLSLSCKEGGGKQIFPVCALRIRSTYPIPARQRAYIYIYIYFAFDNSEIQSDNFRQLCRRYHAVRRLSRSGFLFPPYPRISIMRISSPITPALIAPNAAAGAWIKVVCLDFNADTNTAPLREKGIIDVFRLFFPSLPLPFYQRINQKVK